jgi:hypothetical protein
MEWVLTAETEITGFEVDGHGVRQEDGDGK